MLACLSLDCLLPALAVAAKPATYTLKAKHMVMDLADMRSIYTDIFITDGTTSVAADHASVVTGTGLQDGRYVLNDNVKFGNSLAMVYAATATLQFKDGALVSGDFTGKPVKLHVLLKGQDAYGFSQNIVYDNAHKLVRMVGGVRLSNRDGVYQCSAITYRLDSGLLDGTACSLTLDGKSAP